MARLRSALVPDWERAARFAVHRTGTWLERDDAMQIARTAAWSASQRWKPGHGATELTWCTQRAIGALRDQERTQARQVAVVVTDPDRFTRLVDPGPHPHQLADLVDRATATPADRRTALRLADGWTPRQIAAADKQSPRAVEARIEKMRERLLMVA